MEQNKQRSGRGGLFANHLPRYFLFSSKRPTSIILHVNAIHEFLPWSMPFERCENQKNCTSSRGLSKILFKLATMCPTDACSNDRSGPHTDKYMPTRLRAHLRSTIINQQSAGTGKTKPGQKSVADGICRCQNSCSCKCTSLITFKNIVS